MEMDYYRMVLNATSFGDFPDVAKRYGDFPAKIGNVEILIINMHCFSGEC